MAGYPKGRAWTRSRTVPAGSSTSQSGPGDAFDLPGGAEAAISVESHRFGGLRYHLLARLAVAQQLARGGAGALAVLEGHLAVDQRVAIAVRPLDAPPLAAGEVVGDLAGPLRVHPQLLQVVH